MPLHLEWDVRFTTVSLLSTYETDDVSYLKKGHIWTISFYLLDAVQKPKLKIITFNLRNTRISHSSFFSDKSVKHIVVNWVFWRVVWSLKVTFIVPLTFKMFNLVLIRRHHASFYGFELVTWLVEFGLARTRQDAESLGRHLIRGRVIRHVDDHLDFYDGRFVYTFLPVNRRLRN